MNYDLERVLEDQFIGLLEGKISCPVRSWSDTKVADLTPIVLVNAVEVGYEPGTANFFNAYRIRVDFGVFTSKRKDFGAREAGEIRGQIREILSDDTLETVLSENDNIHVYDHGAISIDASNLEEDKYWRKDESIEIVCSSK